MEILQRTTVTARSYCSKIAKTLRQRLHNNVPTYERRYERTRSRTRAYAGSRVSERPISDKGIWGSLACSPMCSYRGCRHPLPPADGNANGSPDPEAVVHVFRQGLEAVLFNSVALIDYAIIARASLLRCRGIDVYSQPSATSSLLPLPPCHGNRAKKPPFELFNFSTNCGPEKFKEYIVRKAQARENLRHPRKVHRHPRDPSNL